MTPPAFRYEPLPGRIVFGPGTLAHLPDEVDALKLERLLILSTPNQAGQAEQVAELLRHRAAGIFSGARMHTPVEVTDAALEQAQALRIDGVVAIGGGSTIGLGKALSLRTKLPQVAIPTTYAGSEVTPILGETAKGVKTTQRSSALLPCVVIYDVDLTLDLPVPISVTSGLNAIAHAAEALYARDGNPVISLMAEAGVRSLADALPLIVETPRDREARGAALYGAWLCGTCLGAVGMSLHHKLCHTLGGTFDLPHAETHAVILPHALAYNLDKAPHARQALMRALGIDGDPAHFLHLLAKRLGAPTALRDLGMPEEGIARAADLAVQNPYWNPRPVTRDAIQALLSRAWRGKAPEYE